jgi:hypothetical protein
MERMKMTPTLSLPSIQTLIWTLFLLTSPPFSSKSSSRQKDSAAAAASRQQGSSAQRTRPRLSLLVPVGLGFSTTVVVPVS